MKIRTGFVSNSSSSSFCIFGVNFEEGYFNCDELTEEAILFLKENDLLDQIDDEEENSEIAYELSEHFGVESHTWYGHYFGTSWRYVGDDQTGKQFKNSVKENLQKIFKSESEVWKTLGTHEEAYND